MVGQEQFRFHQFRFHHFDLPEQHTGLPVYLAAGGRYPVDRYSVAPADEPRSYACSYELLHIDEPWARGQVVEMYWGQLGAQNLTLTQPKRAEEILRTWRASSGNSRFVTLGVIVGEIKGTELAPSIEETFYIKEHGHGPKAFIVQILGPLPDFSQIER